MQAKLIIMFPNLRKSDFLGKAGTIVDALRNNPDFPEPWPSQVSSFAQLEAAYNAYQDALHAASVEGAASYQASHTEGNPSDETRWQDDGAWTDPASLMVI